MLSGNTLRLMMERDVKRRTSYLGWGQCSKECWSGEGPLIEALQGINPNDYYLVKIPEGNGNYTNRVVFKKNIEEKTKK